jgi:glycosyltransferase involved in cell wall biosynthesis
MHIVHTESSQGWGGQELRILGESAGLRARGHEVTLIAPASARIFAEAQRRGLPVVDLPIGRKTLRGWLALRRWLMANRVDVVNTHSSTDSWLVALACATLARAPAIVRTRHVSVPVANNVAARWLYRHATRRIVTTGEALRRTLIETNDLPADRIVSVPTGVDLTRFAPGDKSAARAALGLDPAARYVGIVATLRSWKGHLYLIEALERLGRGDCRLLVVGDGPMREPIASRIAAGGLGDRVKLAGHQDDPAPWLRAMDVFCLPSYANEGVPQALMQAMLAGVPVVTTPVGSILEVVEDGRTGLVVPPRDAAALASAIARLLDDPELARRLGSTARAEAVQRFSQDRMLDQMEAVFRAALGAT